MGKRFIDGLDLIDMMNAGAAVLKSHVTTINNLNVFPVPDGDTGTNMNMTMASGIDLIRQKPSAHAGHCAETLSKGLLMGARGNSGVILSQLFRGFAKAVHHAEKIDVALFAAALQQGVETAFQAVVKPVEGTILTVSREAARHAVAVARRSADLADLMREVHAKAKETLARTPDMLPILKQVGVVDSGGQGLVFLYEGFAQWLAGEWTDPGEQGGEVARPADRTRAAAPEAPAAASRAAAISDKAQVMLATEDIEFPYDMEFFIHLEQRKEGPGFDPDRFREELARDGDSILIIADGDDVKVHVHTRAPGDVLNLAMRFGELSRFHIENMRETHRAILREEPGAAGTEEANRAHTPSGTVPDAVSAGASTGGSSAGSPASGSGPVKRYGIVTVAAGKGMSDIFRSLGADVVLNGGQTMNPSTEDFVQAIKGIAAETVFVFPNNSNIIMAAEQAIEWADKQVIVIPSKTIPQGMSGLLAFQPSRSAEENCAAMAEAIRQVKSGHIAASIRDTEMDGVSIRKGDYLAIVDNKIVHSKPDLVSAGKALMDELLANGEEVVTILTGEGALPEQTEEIISYVEETYPDVEVECRQGDQPVYPYIVSAE